MQRVFVAYCLTIGKRRYLCKAISYDCVCTELARRSEVETDASRCVGSGIVYIGRKLVDRHTGFQIEETERFAGLEVAAKHCVNGDKHALVGKRGVNAYSYTGALYHSLAIACIYIYIEATAFST